MIYQTIVHVIVFDDVRGDVLPDGHRAVSWYPGGQGNGQPTHNR